jgi:hypothetical protein
MRIIGSGMGVNLITVRRGRAVEASSVTLGRRYTGVSLAFRFDSSRSLMLMSVVMVYKGWHCIAKEDSEFSVESKAAVREVKVQHSPHPARALTYGPGYNGGGYGGRMEPDGRVMRLVTTTIPKSSGYLVCGVSGRQYYSHGYPPLGGGGYN